MRNRNTSYFVPQTTQTNNHLPLAYLIAAIKHFLIILATVPLTLASASAAKVTLAWDKNDPTPDGYNVYWRTKDTRFDYGEPIWSGNDSSCTINLPNVPENIQCYFVVRAYVDDDESGDSNEVSYLLQAATEDTQTPQVSSGLQPQADAGSNLTVPAGSTVTLDGSNSIAPDGILTSYNWVQTTGPTVQLSIKSPAVATFTAPTLSNTQQGLILVFELTVADDAGRTCTDTCLVQVTRQNQQNDTGGGTQTNQDDTSASDADDWANTGKDSVDDTDNTEDDWNDADSTVAGQNQPPLQPSIVYPKTGADSVSLRPKILASEFEDDEAQNYHFASQWRIIETESQEVVLNVRRTYYLTYLRVPMFILKRGTTYSCQVRYFDQEGNGSDWSSPVTFTTYGRLFSWQAAATASDGYALEANLADFEATDTLATYRTLDENHIISIRSHDTENFIDLASSGPIPTADEASTPPDFDNGVYSYGLIGNRIEVADPGAETSFIINVDDDLSRTTNWIMFTADGQWVDDQLSVQPLSDGQSVIRTVTDGGQGDADGVANGVIVDLVAPLAEDSTGDDLPSQGQPTFLSKGSGQMGCFIGSLFK